MTPVIPARISNPYKYGILGPVDNRVADRAEYCYLLPQRPPERRRRQMSRC